MNKYVVHISFYIKAKTRLEAIDLTEDLINEKFRKLASLDEVERKPVDHPEWVIALNEPIRKHG